MSYRATTLASYIPRSYISSNAILNILPDASKHDLFPFKSFFNSFPKLAQGALVTLLKKKDRWDVFFRGGRRNEECDGIGLTSPPPGPGQVRSMATVLPCITCSVTDTSMHHK